MKISNQNDILFLQKIRLIPLLLLITVFSSKINAQIDGCPLSWDDAGVAITDPNPTPNEGTPELSVDGIYQFVINQGINDIASLLATMPPSMRKNYALVEQTGTGLLASAVYPRMLMFGSDARTMIALGSHPDEPDRETLDIASLDDATGLWKFRSLDMSQSPPELSVDDAACVGCHGIPARPIWGSYPDWPGMFGAVQDELTPPQAVFLESMRNGDAELSDRFQNMVFSFPFGAVSPGDTFVLPDRIYPYVNTVFNMELGPAVADGVYRRMKQAPYYQVLKEEIIFNNYCSGYPEADQQLQDLVTSLGAASANRDDILLLLGIDASHDLNIGQLASLPYTASWNVSTDSLYGLINMLILNELMYENPQIQSILASTPEQDTPFSRGCFDNLEDALKYKIYQGWTLRSESRQAAREVDYDVNLMRARQGIFDQVEAPLCDYLAKNISINLVEDLIFKNGYEQSNL